ncbi:MULTISPECIES: hypothetical protein [Candidatus Ichthyocystis]|uniref:EF-hand domain-containing protein n=1 Tax=Candidatus Ichthyocystis hellenicum TaxID=1561003 RepID=A0A0S4M1K9_9BURK|nr:MULTISPECIES: hypothetical protein [Ichthyocystis]CUT17657.1 hypothetical protein Ark11_0834 [Candidatus Ichthyocystis hellenicum]
MNSIGLQKVCSCPNSSGEFVDPSHECLESGRVLCSLKIVDVKGGGAIAGGISSSYDSSAVAASSITGIGGNEGSESGSGLCSLKIVDIRGHDDSSTASFCTSSLPDESLQGICYGYASCDDLDAIKDVYKDDFFQLYAKGNGYELTEDFLSKINEYKAEFSSKVDLILSNLNVFLAEEVVTTTIEDFMSKVCSSFCRSFFSIRPKCIDFLQSYVVPLLEEKCLNSSVICAGTKRNMTYPEVERFFLYYVTSLERLVMLRAVGFWDKFRNANEYVLSLASSIDYSNPFNHFDSGSQTDITNINHPSAFVYKFGRYISFVASSKVDSVVSYLVSKCSVELKKTAYSKCFNIAFNGHDPYIGIKQFRNGLKAFILKEFNDKMVKEKVNDTLGKFFDRLVVWDDVNAIAVERSSSVVFDDITKYSYKLLEGNIHRSIDDTAMHFQVVLSSYRKFQLNVHPDDFLCDKYGYIIDPGSMDVYKDDFFQLHPERMGYQLTEDFLSVVNKCRGEFITRVDTILSSLSGIFFGRFSKSTIVCFMNGISSSFCEAVCDLRPKCIEVLQSYVVPLIIKTVFYCNVVDNNSSRSMTHNEMEQFFMHYVTSLERVIMLRAINHWHNLCKSNGHILALVPGIDYSNPFHHFYSGEKNSDNLLSHPPAFVYNFGSYISFVAFYKIDEIVSDFVKRNSIVLKNTVHRKCCDTSKYSRDPYVDFGNLIKGLRNFVLKEFRSKIIEEGVIDSLGSFLSRSIIWDKYEIGSEDAEGHHSSIIDEIIDYMYKSLEYSVYDDIRNTAMHFQCISVLASFSKKPKVIYKLGAIIDRFELNVHPDDCSRILFVREKTSLRIVRHLTNIFSRMLKDKVALKSGEVVCKESWSRDYDELRAVALKSLEPIFKDEHVELIKALSKSRIVDMTKGVVASCVIRKISDDDKINIAERAKYRGKELDSSIRRAWSYAISDLDSENVDGSSSVNVGLYEPDCKWGVEFSYCDSFVISNARERFLSKFRVIIYNKFCEMLKSKHELYADKVIDDDYLNDVLKELSPIVQKEFSNFVESGSAFEEISKIMSGLRAEIDSDNDRELTNQEVSVILGRFVKLSDNELKYLFRKVKEESVNYVVLLSAPNSEEGGVSKSLDSNILLNVVDYESNRKLADIRFSFIEKFRPVVIKTINSLFMSSDSLLDSLDDILEHVTPGLSKQCQDMFKDEGFLSRAESLLEDSVKVESFASGYHSLSDKNRILGSFISSISVALDSLIRECATSLIVGATSSDDQQLDLDRNVLVNNVDSECNKKLADIRFSFIERFRPIVVSAVESLTVSSDLSPHNDLDNILSRVRVGLVGKQCHDMFMEEGFFARAESLVEEVMKGGAFVNDAHVLSEKNRILGSFVGSISVALDCLIKECAASLISVVASSSERKRVDVSLGDADDLDGAGSKDLGKRITVFKVEDDDVPEVVVNLDDDGSENIGRKRTRKRRHIDSDFSCKVESDGEPEVIVSLDDDDFECGVNRSMVKRVTGRRTKHLDKDSTSSHGEDVLWV